jgi:hypothetical protein
VDNLAVATPPRNDAPVHFWAINEQEQTFQNKIRNSQDNHDFLFGKQTKDQKKTFVAGDC